jgi:uncharacterized membrane protein YfcA
MAILGETASLAILILITAALYASVGQAGASGYLAATGGGVFLAPVILTMGWVEVRRAAAVTAAYNLLNSASALASAYATLGVLPPALPWWLVAAGVGGVIGSTVGSRHLPDRALRYVLAAVLVVAGIRPVLS